MPRWPKSPSNDSTDGKVIVIGTPVTLAQRWDHSMWIWGLLNSSNLKSLEYLYKGCGGGGQAGPWDSLAGQPRHQWETDPVSKNKAGSSWEKEANIWPPPTHIHIQKHVHIPYTHEHANIWITISLKLFSLKWTCMPCYMLHTLLTHVRLWAVAVRWEILVSF